MKDGGSVLRRELSRLGWVLPGWWAVGVIVALLLTLLLPRIWIVDAELDLAGADDAAFTRTKQALREELKRSGDGTVHLERRGRSLLVALHTAGEAAELDRRLESVFDDVLAEARQSHSRELEAERTRLEDALAQRRDVRAAADHALADALREQPAGGDTAVAARLGRMQAEVDGLAIEIRDGATRARALQARVAELDVAVRAGEPDAAAVERLEHALQQARERLDALPPGDVARTAAQADVDSLSAELERARAVLATQRADAAGLTARRESAREELANQRSRNQTTTRRESELRKLVEQTREELLRLQGENQSVQRLHAEQQSAESAERVARQNLERHQQLVERLRAEPRPLFRIVTPPEAPRLMSGMLPVQAVGLAVAAGVLLALLRLLATTVVGRRTRSLALLAGDLHVRALVELPVWRDAMADPGAKVRRAGALLFTAVGVVACLVYLVVV